MSVEKPMISLRGVFKSYGSHKVLNNINQEIYPGDFICIYGKSGGGKTTLLNIIGTLESYEKGQVTCFSKKDPFKKSKDSEILRRYHIAYLFQNFALVDNMTVEQNMKLAMKYTKAKNKQEMIVQALKKMGVSEKLNSKIYELSGGEQQRVAIARNMVKPYDIMLADEPTGSLDEENKRIVFESLVALNKSGKTIVVVSHDWDFHLIANRIFQIENGTVLEVKNEL